MSISILLLGILLVLLLSAALFDLVSYTIPNRLIVAMLALFVIFLMTTWVDGQAPGWADLGLHLLSGAVALAAGIGLFVRGWIGGGDAKFFAVTCLWLGWDNLLNYAVAASFLGGGLALAILMLRFTPLPATLAARPWVQRLADSRSGVPYGVALGLAALLIFPGTDLFRLAVS